MNPVSTVIVVYACIATGIFVFRDLLLVYLTIRVFGKNTRISEVLDAEALEIPDFNLPLISILLPVYREELTLPNLVKSIANSD